LPAFKSGELMTLQLDLDMLAHDFLIGHQVRLTVVPSLFPLYARNLQGADYMRDHEPCVADIELHHGAGTSASLILPLAHRDVLRGVPGCASQRTWDG
jgi:predicted acyl esterase